MGSLENNQLSAVLQKSLKFWPVKADCSWRREQEPTAGSRIHWVQNRDIDGGAAWPEQPTYLLDGEWPLLVPLTLPLGVRTGIVVAHDPLQLQSWVTWLRWQGGVFITAQLWCHFRSIGGIFISFNGLGGCVPVGVAPSLMHSTCTNVSADVLANKAFFA